MSFIKSIVGWFKRKPKTPASKYSDLLNATLVSRAAEIESVVRASNPILSYLSSTPNEREMQSLDTMIAATKSQLARAKRGKKKVSHIHKKLEGLVARKLELEGK